jgi:hypothetical protein
MDGALVDVGSHHPKKGMITITWACVLSIELRFCFFFSFFFCWSKQGHGFLNFVM